MRTIILETRDGWRKRMAVPAREYSVRVSVMSARDFAIDREEVFDPARTAHYRVMDFEWDGETTDDEVEMVHGEERYRRLEVWRER